MSPQITYEQDAHPRPLVVREQDIETDFVEKLRSLKYEYRPDIRDRDTITPRCARPLPRGFTGHVAVPKGSIHMTAFQWQVEPLHPMCVRIV